MADAAPSRNRVLDAVLAIGAYPEETEVQRGARRVMIVAAYRSTQGRTVDGFFRALPEPGQHPAFRVEPIA